MSTITRAFLQGFLACGLATCLSAQAQGLVFRCGIEYTNDPRRAAQPDCTALELGPVTVPGTKVARSQETVPIAPRVPETKSELRAPRVQSTEQLARDADARHILQAELRKAEARLALLQAEFKQGEPDKQGIEGRNHQRYLDRVQRLREDLVRQQSDVDSLKRELARLPGTARALAGSP